MSKFLMHATVAALVFSWAGGAAHAMSQRGGEGEDAQPRTPFVSTLTRAEVQAEAQRARAAGEVTHGDHTAAPELQSRAPGLTRAQVVAELREAVRLGVIGQGDTLVVPTPQQQALIRMAGERALALQMASR